MINREQVLDAHAKKIMRVWNLVIFKTWHRRLSISIYKAMGFWARLQVEQETKELRNKIIDLIMLDEKNKLQAAAAIIELQNKVKELKELRAADALDMSDLIKKNRVAIGAFNNILLIQNGVYFHTPYGEKFTAQEISNSALLVIK